MSSSRPLRKRSAQEVQDMANAFLEASRKKIWDETDPYETQDDDAQMEDAPAPQISVQEAYAMIQEPLPGREPAPEVEMTEPEQPVDAPVDAPVDLATLEITDDQQYNHRNMPKSLVVPCIARKDVDVDIGTLRQNGNSPGSWQFTFILDFGRYGKPAFMLRCRRNKDATQKLDESKPDSYLEVIFEWQPGVSFVINNGEKLYQLDNLTRNVLSKENVPVLAELGVYYPRAGSEIERLSDSDKARCVHINFQSRTPRIETDVIKTQAIANTTKAEKEFIGDLYSEDVVDMSLTFLLPLGSQYSDRGIDGSVERSLSFLNVDYPIFQDAFENRLPPLYPYCDFSSPERPLNVNFNMQSINTFANRMLVIYKKDKREALEAELQETGAIARWPPGDAFYHYRKQIFFTTTSEFLTHVLGSVVRDQQWVEGEYMAYSAQDINFAVVRSYQGQLLGDVELTEEDKTRRQGFFLYGYLPKNKKLHLPALDSQWNIEFKKTVHGKQVHQERNVRWTGYVKPITDDERQVTGAQFVMVATRPLGGQRISWAPSIPELAPGNYHPGRMTQIVDRVGQNRILKACKEFCDPLRTDLESFRIPLIFAREIKAFHQVNLIKGGNPNNEDQNRTFFDWVFRLIQGRLNKDQKQFFEKDLRQIWNGTKFVKGGPGCIKTSTMAWVVLLLSLIDHKVMIVAEDNGSVNQFMKTLEGVRVELGLAAMQSKSPESKVLLDKLIGHTHFRFVPPVQEKDALLDNDVGTGNMHRTGRPDDPDAWKNTADAMSLIMASLSHREALAKMDAESAERAELEAKLSRHQDDLGRLRSEYTRRAERSGRVNEFPARQSIVYFIEALRKVKRQGQLPTTDERMSLIDTYDKAQEALLRGQGNPRKLARALSMATDALYAWVARNSHVLGTTHGSCVNALVKGNFRPTVVVHEEGSRVKVPTALCAMSFENVKAHIFVGDLHQLPPFQSSKTMNEFSEMGELSILQLYQDKGHGSSWLNINYRCHPDILDFPNRHVYEGRLENAACTTVMTVEHKAFSDVFIERYATTVVSQYYFINTTRSIAHLQAGGSSLENWADAKVAVVLCKAWIEKGILAIKITILCFYRGQIDVVNEYLKRYGISGVQVVSVDQFQSGDNDFTISLLTATAHKSLMTVLDNERDYFQDVSVFVKLYKRLNVAATRAKKGHLFIGSATTLDRAVQKEASGAHLRALIHDAIERRVMLIDETEDESPYVQKHLMSSENALREFQEETSSLQNLGWMSEHREKRVQIVRKAAKQKPQKVTYGGRDQAGQFGTFPPNVKDATVARQSQPGAVRWSDQERESTKNKGKKRK